MAGAAQTKTPGRGPGFCISLVSAGHHRVKIGPENL